MEKDLTCGGKHKIKYIDDVLQNSVPETYIFLLTNVTKKIQLKNKISQYIGKPKKKHLLNGLFPLLGGFPRRQNLLSL